MRETLEATKQVPVTDAKPTPVSTDAEDQTGEYPLLPGVVIMSPPTNCVEARLRIMSFLR